MPTLALSGPIQAKLGDKISVMVNTQGAVSLRALTLAVSYDSEILKPLSVTEGDLMRRSGLQSTFAGKMDEVAGNIAIDLNAEGSASGNGGVAIIQFEVIGRPGRAALVQLASVQATDAVSTNIPMAMSAPLSIEIQP